MQQNSYRFQLLAPAEAGIRATSLHCIGNSELYEKYLGSMQRLRGRVYLKDTAIQPWDLDSTGRHRMDDDTRCWHLLLVDSSDEVVGCARYLLHPPNVLFENLRLRHAPLATHPFWGKRLRKAIEADLKLAREAQLGYAELGGWAIAEQYRNTRAALEILLGSYAWGQLIGNCICCCTATVRNRSSSILRRIGGMSLVSDGEPLPPYDDPQYGCVMEVLRFDSQSLDPRFRPLVNELQAQLRHTESISRVAGESQCDELSFSESLAALNAALKPNPVLELNRSAFEKV